MFALRFFGAIGFVVFCTCLVVSIISKGIVPWWAAFAAAGFFMVVPAIAVFIVSGRDMFRD